MSDHEEMPSEGGGGGGLAVKLGAGVMALGAMLARSADDCGRVAVRSANGLDDVGRVAAKGDDLGQWGRAARAGKQPLPGAGRGLPGFAGLADDTKSFLPAGLRHSEDALAARRLAASEPDIAGEAWQSAAEEALGQAIDWASWQDDNEDAPLVATESTSRNGPQWVSVHLLSSVGLKVEQLTARIAVSPFALFINGERQSDESHDIVFDQRTLAPGALLWRCLAASKPCVVLSWPAGMDGEDIASVHSALLDAGRFARGGNGIETALAASLGPLSFSRTLRLHLLHFHNGQALHVVTNPTQLSATPPSRVAD